jgi:iron(III) transport system substrate-binding protein
MAKLSRSAAPLLAIAIVALITLLMLSAASAAAQWRREVVVYSARIEPLITPMFDVSTAKTGIQVTYLTAGEKEWFERLHSEGANTPADVFMTVDVGNLWIAEQAGLLQGVTPEVIDHNIPSHLRANDHAWVGLSVRAPSHVSHRARHTQRTLDL